MNERIAETAEDILQLIDSTESQYPGNKLEEIVVVGENTGTTTLRIGKCALDDVCLQVGIVDTQLPTQDMRAVLIVTTDHAAGTENSGYLRLFNVDPSTGVHRLMSGEHPPQKAGPIEICGIGVIIDNTDFSDPQPLLEAERRMESEPYMGVSRFADILLDPRPLV